MKRYLAVMFLVVFGFTTATFVLAQEAAMEKIAGEAVNSQIMDNSDVMDNDALHEEMEDMINEEAEDADEMMDEEPMPEDMPMGAPAEAPVAAPAEKNMGY